MMSKSLPNNVEELRRMLLQTQRELAVSEQKTKELTETLTEQEQQLAAKDNTIAELLAALRGKPRERFDPNQMLLFDLGELEQVVQEEQPEPQPARRRKRRHGRRLIPDDLPHEEIIHELPEEQRRCPHDGKLMQVIRYEISKQLEYVPPALKVLVHKRAVYACPTKHDEASLLTAPKPPQPIEKGLPGPGLLAAIVLGKFGDHLPGYRLEDIFSRNGREVAIRRSTIYDWLTAAADLAEPLYQRMCERVLQSQVLHTDDTQVKLIDNELKGTRLARFWAYVGDRGHPYIVYDFTNSREREGPQAFLEGYTGYLQADAYSGYDGIYLKSNGTIIEVACWAHCRRYWWKARKQDAARAHHVAAVVRQLYAIERDAKDVDAETRRQMRAEQAAPLLADLKRWLDSQEFLPKSLSGKAATYTLNQWDALTRYLEDGNLSIDNNISERAVKPVAIGRKAWLFVGSEEAGQRAAVLMSLIASCKDNRVEPWAYLRDVFQRIPAGAPIDQLLPDQWLLANPNARWHIADQRQAERNAKGNL